MSPSRLRHPNRTRLQILTLTGPGPPELPAHSQRIATRRRRRPTQTRPATVTAAGAHQLVPAAPGRAVCLSCGAGVDIDALHRPSRPLPTCQHHSTPPLSAAGSTVSPNAPQEDAA